MRTMRFPNIILLLLANFLNFTYAHKLLLLFLDGFRWDYIDHTSHLSGFTEIRTKGFYIRQVVPVFPADCHPNIYSIFTGLYPQHHGVVAKKVYSDTKKREFDHQNSFHRRDVHRWVDAEPLWVTSRKQGKRSFMYHLPICETSLGPLSPSYCVPFHADYMTMGSMNVSVTEALRSLRSGVASMAVVYNDQLDRLTHQFGPDSSILVENLLPAIDLLIQSLLTKIRGTDINLVVLSDHGMAQIAMDRQIFLERIILRSDIERVINEGGYVSIWPQPNRYDATYKRLLMASQDPDSHFKLYTHATMPSEWNALKPNVTPPLLLVADPGYFIVSKELSYPSGKDFYNSGWHGYAPEHEEMASPLLGFGSGFEPGTHLPVSHVTEVYQLLADLLGVVPLSHNGSSLFLKSIQRGPRLVGPLSEPISLMTIVNSGRHGRSGGGDNNSIPVAALIMCLLALLLQLQVR